MTYIVDRFGEKLNLTADTANNLRSWSDSDIEPGHVPKWDSDLARWTYGEGGKGGIDAYDSDAQYDSDDLVFYNNAIWASNTKRLAGHGEFVAGYEAGDFRPISGIVLETAGYVETTDANNTYLSNISSNETTYATLTIPSDGVWNVNYFAKLDCRSGTAKMVVKDQNGSVLNTANDEYYDNHALDWFGRGLKNLSLKAGDILYFTMQRTYGTVQFEGGYPGNSSGTDKPIIFEAEKVSGYIPVLGVTTDFGQTLSPIADAASVAPGATIFTFSPASSGTYEVNYHIGLQSNTYEYATFAVYDPSGNVIEGTQRYTIGAGMPIDNSFSTSCLIEVPTPGTYTVRLVTTTGGGAGNIFIRNGTTTTLRGYTSLSYKQIRGSVPYGFTQANLLSLDGATTNQFGAGGADTSYAGATGQSQAYLSQLTATASLGGKVVRDGNYVKVLEAGTYKVTATLSVRDSGGAATALQGQIGKNDSPIGNEQQISANSNYGVNMPLEVIVQADVNDKFDARFWTGTSSDTFGVSPTLHFAVEQLTGKSILPTAVAEPVKRPIANPFNGIWKQAMDDLGQEYWYPWEVVQTTPLTDTTAPQGTGGAWLSMFGSVIGYQARGDLDVLGTDYVAGFKADGVYKFQYQLQFESTSGTSYIFLRLRSTDNAILQELPPIRTVNRAVNGSTTNTFEIVYDGADLVGKTIGLYVYEAGSGATIKAGTSVFKVERVG